MEKVKFFSDTLYQRLEKEINEWYDQMEASDNYVKIVDRVLSSTSDNITVAIFYTST